VILIKVDARPLARASIHVPPLRSPCHGEPTSKTSEFYHELPSSPLRRVALFEGVDCTDGDGPRVACAMSGCSVRGVLGPMDMTGARADAAARIPVPVPVGP